MRILNADARIIETSQSRVALSDVLDTKLFNEERAQEHPLWHKELFGFADHVPETEEYGIRSFVYRAKRPFHPQKFHALLERGFPKVIRAQGAFLDRDAPALDRRDEPRRQDPAHRGARQLVGGGTAGALADVGRVQVDHQPALDPDLGRPAAEIVFIGGPEMDEVAIRASLDECLVGSVTTGLSQSHLNLPDPFPVWGQAKAA